MYEFIISFIDSFWMLTAEMAPWLLLGFLVAGFLHAYMPVALVTRHIGGESASAVIKASLLGIPLPLCSCGVLPVAASLRKSGAGKAPTLAFLITTPVTGVDSLAATWSLMGWFFMLARLVVSVVIGLVTGLIQSFVGRSDGDTATLATSGGPACVDCEEDHHEHGAGFAGRIKTALSYAFLELPETIAVSILTGLVLGGLITALLPPEIIERYIGTGIWGIMAATAIGIPLYVCATGSIPIAAALLMKGFSPGAALAFMVAGPATNMVAISTVSKLLGKRSLFIYLSVIFVGALGSGLLLDWIFPQARQWLPDFTAHHHQHGLSLFEHLAASVFLLLTVTLYLKSRIFPLGFASKKHKGAGDMKEIFLSVPAMSCNHCKQSVARALSGIEGVAAVEVNLGTKEVRVSCQSAPDEKKLLAALQSVGFEAEILRRG